MNLFPFHGFAFAFFSFFYESPPLVLRYGVSFGCLPSGASSGFDDLPLETSSVFDLFLFLICGSICGFFSFALFAY